MKQESINYDRRGKENSEEENRADFQSRLICSHYQRETNDRLKPQRSVLPLTGILDLDSGVWLRVGFVDHLGANLLSQNLHLQKFKGTPFKQHANHFYCDILTKNNVNL